MNSYWPSTVRTPQLTKVSGVSGTGSGTVNGDAKTQEAGSSRTSPHRRRTRQENAYGERSVMTKESVKAQNPIGTDNHQQQSPNSPKTTKKMTSRECLTTETKPSSHANASMKETAGNPHANNQVTSEPNQSGQKMSRPNQRGKKTSGQNQSRQKTQPGKATEQLETAYW